MNPQAHTIIYCSKKDPLAKDLRKKKKKKKDPLTNIKQFPSSLLCNTFLNTFTNFSNKHVETEKYSAI